MVVLDEKLDSVNKKGSILCRTSLLNYLENLPEDFNDFSVQRGIVANNYLDNIIDTIMDNDSIPIITLVSYSGYNGNINNKVQISNFNVLDGLQRTWRLKVILNIIRCLKKIYDTDEKIQAEFLTKSIRQIDPEVQREIMATGVYEYRQAKKYAQKISKHGFNNVEKKITETQQWFEILYGLEDKEIIKKMLLLNAGHKAVSSKHQIELLYFSYYDIFKNNKMNYRHKNFVIKRDKEIPSQTTFINTREVNTFKFSDLIIATIAFFKGGCTQTNTILLKQEYLDQDDESISERFSADSDIYNAIIEFLCDIDEILSMKYKDEGRKWFGKGNHIEGVLAAAGKYCLERNKGESTEYYLRLLSETVNEKINQLQIDKFTDGKDTIKADRVNMGILNKNTVFNVFYKLFEDPEHFNYVDWKKEFTHNDN